MSISEIPKIKLDQLRTHDAVKLGQSTIQFFMKVNTPTVELYLFPTLGLVSVKDSRLNHTVLVPVANCPYMVCADDELKGDPESEAAVEAPKAKASKAAAAK